MGDLFIVRSRLKLTMWLVGATLVGSLLGAWDAWNRIGVGGEGEPRYFLFVAVSGALALALVGLFIVFLTIDKFMKPNPDGWLSRIPWWVVRTVVLLLLIGAGVVVVQRLSAKVADEFTLLKKGKIPELGEYLDQHPEALNRTDKKTGRTLLELALESGRVDAVNLVLSYEGVDALNASGWLIGMIDNPSMVETLLQHGADPNVLDSVERTPVYYAAKAGNTNSLVLLLNAGADVNVLNASFQSPLMLAVVEGDLSAVKLLLEQGADPNQIDQNGETALHKAVRRRNPEIVRCLLKNGADPKILNFSDMAPIHIAASNGQDQLVKIFLEQPGQLNLVGKTNRNALDHALRRHKYATARLLLENGADINRIMEDGYTPTHIMLIARDYEVVKFLIEEGADVRIADSKGETAYFFMRKKKLQTLIDQVDARDHPEKAAETNAVETVESP